MIRAKARLLPALLPLLAAACSTAGNYPSLQPRDVERISGSAHPVPGAPVPSAAPAPVGSADAGLAARIANLVAQAQDANSRFQALRSEAQRAVAAAGPIGSDSWSGASIALARLESSRSLAMVALADLDTLYVNSRVAAPMDESPSAAAIAAARNEVTALTAAQDQAIAALAARLPR